MEKTIEIQLAEHGERIAQAIMDDCSEFHSYWLCTCGQAVDIARVIK